MKTLSQDGVGIAFYLASLAALPWMVTRIDLIFAFSAAFLVFTAIRNAKFLIPHFETGESGLDHEATRKEFLNRISSIVFNISTGIPTYLDYYHFLPRDWWLDHPHTLEVKIPFACAWSMGYVFYDFVYMKPNNVTMRIHHLGEMVILLTTAYVQSLGMHYMLGGAIMQISSAFLHLGKILFLIGQLNKGKKVSWLKTATQIQYYLIIITWIHGRLFMWPQWMYNAWIANPGTGLHILLVVTGIVLTGANVIWLYKIVRKTPV